MERVRAARRVVVSIRWLVLAFVLLAGCAAADESDEESGSAATGRTADGDEIEIRLEESPTNGGAFDFCSRPGEGSPIHLKNAAWLSMMAANQYSHFSYLATQLLDLGFGRPGGTDNEWRQCGFDLHLMKVFEEQNRAALDLARAGGAASLVAYVRQAQKTSPASFGPCTQEFMKEYDGLDEDKQVAPPEEAFKDWLLRETADTDWIQFFNGRPYSFAEKYAFKKGSTQVFIARHATKPIVVISFRGTEAGTDGRHIADFVSDLSLMKTDLASSSYGFSKGWGEAHSGFVNALQSVDDPTVAGKDLLSSKLDALTKTVDGQKVAVWITGHSLGGAVATLMTARLLDKMNRDKAAGREVLDLRGLYTFGSPRVGSATFASKLEASAAAHRVQIGRFRNSNDAVTSVGPDLGILGGYKHLGTLAYLTNDKLEVSAEKDLSYNYLKLFSEGMADHSITGFIRTGSTRQITSGYYTRIIKHSAAHAPLDICASP